MSEDKWLKTTNQKSDKSNAHTNTLIDIFTSTHENNIAAKIVYPSGTSDHHLVGIIRKLNSKKFVARRTLVRSYKNYSKKQLNNDLHRQNWESVINFSSFNKASNSFKTLLEDCIDKHTPPIEKMISGRDCPWLTLRIKEKMKE